MAITCEECFKKIAALKCFECDQNLCTNCNSLIHRGGARKNHKRLPICDSCSQPALFFCKSCQSHSCTKDSCVHLKNYRGALNFGVFWDISLFGSKKYPSISDILNEIKLRISEPKIIKIYTDNWIDVRLYRGYDVIFRHGISPFETLLIDLSVLVKSLTHALVILPKISEARGKLLYLKKAGLEIIASKSVCPLVFCDLDKALPKPGKILSENYVKHLGRSGNTCFCSEKKLKMISFFCEEAKDGNLLIEKNEFVERFCNLTKYSLNKCLSIMRKLEKSKIINTFCLIFDEECTFLSLRPEKLSKTLVNWVILFLQLNEVSLSYKNIKFFIKLLYKLKFSKKTWELHLSRSSIYHSYPNINRKDLTPFLSSNFNNKGLDKIKSDIYDIEDKEYWSDFLVFIYSYFYNYKDIPLGKYGCALLIKLKGPNSLRFLTIGKIIHLVNLAISEDILRYQNKQFAFNNDFKFYDAPFQCSEELRKKLLSFFLRFPHGIQLSKLKTVLMKNQIFVRPSEFGFNKLNDFLLSFGDLEMFEDCMRIKCQSKIPEEVLTEIVEEYAGRIDSSESVISELEKIVDWSFYNVSSCTEYIKKYIEGNSRFIDRQ